MTSRTIDNPVPPSLEDVRRISAISNPVIRNLEITHCYARLSAAMVQRTGSCANWCTFATWASRQAGRTIRGEDLIETLRTRLGQGTELLHPIASLGRALLRAVLCAVFRAIQKALGLRVGAAGEECGPGQLRARHVGYPAQFIPGSELVGYGALPGARDPLYDLR